MTLSWTPWKPFLAAALLIAAASSTESAFTPVGVSQGYLARSEADQPSAQAAAHALGEFRIVASNLIWLNVVDRYHHEYMEQGGNWQTNGSLLPFLKIITWLDPHFIQAYDVAGAILSGLQRYDEGQKFLADGIRNNPESWQLYYDVAMLHAWYRRDARSALPYARRAYELASDPYDRRRLRLLVKTLRDDIASNRPPVRDNKG